MTWHVFSGVLIVAFLVANVIWPILVLTGVAELSHIYGKTGSREKPYLTRMILGSLRLHFFWRGDEDPHPHNHPWDFWTFPLVSYYEEYVRTVPTEVTPWEWYCGQRYAPGETYTRRRHVQAWRWHKRPAETLHRVLYPSKCRNGWHVTVYDANSVRAQYAKWPIVTIVWTGPVKQSWGFKVNGDIVDWRTYFGWKQA